MKITLISPYPDITSFGIRTLSAYLKEHGHTTTLIFLPDPYGDNIITGVRRYKENTLDELLPLCSDSCLIGISLMTNFFDGAVQITKKLKGDLHSPVIWGGVHPTIKPGECLEYADMVCVGEGEDSLLELVNKMKEGRDYSKTDGIWIRQGDKIVKNRLSPLPGNLDIYPMPDYSMENHYIMEDGTIKPLDNQLTESFLRKGTVSSYLHKTGYQTMMSRGCPYACTYCINDTIRKIYGRGGTLRWRSVGHVMDELLWVKKNMRYVNYIWVSDDEFFARKIGELKEFCLQYKKKVNLPFSCLLSPPTVTEEKMSLLVDAGLIYVQMGIESASPRMQKMFNRTFMSNEKMMKAIQIVNKFKDRMYPPSYDFLLDVPYERDEDRVENLRFISSIPKPYRLQPFRVILYPGTKLYEIAKDGGFIGDERAEIYNRTYVMHEPNYFNLLIALAKGGRFPSKLLRFLISPAAVKLLNGRFVKPLVRFSYVWVKKSYHTLKKAI